MFSLIQSHVQQIIPRVIEWRRYFHQYPELGFEEFKSGEKIATLLEEWGYQVQRNVAKTGVVGVLDTGSNYTLGLRFDMDALPITEATECPFRSKHPGIMHACGHDGHMAVGLGAAYVLAQIRDRLSANIKLIFQPAEEGLGGAKAMINAGVLDHPKVDAILGMHIWPELEAGTVGVRHGVIMAAADRFEIRINGSGGHGGQPHLAVDPIIIGAEVIDGLQKLVSREVPPTEPVVITIGTFHGGSAFNVIPNEVELTGTIRTTDEEVRSKLLRRIRDKVEAIVKGGNATCAINLQRSFLTTINDDRLVDRFREMILELWPAGTLIDLNAPTMTGEDFSEYQRLVPGLYFFVGTRNEEKGLIYPLHHEQYMLDEDILGFAVEVMVNAAVRMTNVR